MRCVRKVLKNIDFVGFLGGFSVFLLCVVGTGIDTDCKNWKEKVFVLRDYIYTYMFRLCSGKFGVAAIEKNCILFRLYQNNRTENRQQKKRIKKKICLVLLSKMCSF